MPATPVDLQLLNTVFARLAARGIPYRLGGKIPLDVDTSDPRIARGIDCSGFVRYALAKATNQALVLPDGSWNQHAWCRDQGLHQLGRYSDVTQADPSRLFIAFINPEPQRVGHVWLIHRAEEPGGDWRQEQPTTLESHGGHGVDSRLWSTRVLLTEVSACYELPAA
jgi:hypothetical protein